MGILMSQMQSLKKQVKSKGEIDGDDDDRGEESQINVSVFYQRIGEYCSFRVTPEYTFAQLNRMMHASFEVPEDDGTLRDDLNLMWPPQATIMDELSKYDEPPKIVLISRIRPVSGAEDQENDLPPSKKEIRKVILVWI